MSKLYPPVNERDHAQGPADAPLTLVEYGDYQCPHCRQAYPVIKAIQQQLGERLRFVFRNFPLSNAHPFAVPAAVAAEAAGRQQRYWPMHDMIYERQNELGNEALFAFAIALQLDMAAFRRDIQDPALSEKVEKDFESGMRSGVNGTPTFFINGRKYGGAFEQEELLAALQREGG